MGEERRYSLLRRIERVAAVERLKTLRLLVEAQAEARRSADLAQRSRGLADNGTSRGAALTGDALTGLLRFSGAMNAIAQDAEAMRQGVEGAITRTSDSLAQLDRKIEQIGLRKTQLRKQLDRKRAARDMPGPRKGLARKLLKTSGRPHGHDKGGNE